VKSDIGTIGLTDYAQAQLNQIVSVELPKPGATLDAGKALGSVESVKAVNEIDAPVSGEVVEVNGALKNAPEKSILIHTDRDGWSRCG
jgi:glycine cleavage system H protein